MSVVRGLPRVFREAKAILGESIVWDPQGFLYWCDITAGLMHRSSIDGKTDGTDDRSAQFPPPLASFAQGKTGGFVASLGDRVVLADDAGQVTEELAVIHHTQPGIRLNEGKCDPYGRWITGSMNFTTGVADGAFYSISPDGECRTLRGGFTVANGVEWSLDDSEIFFTDTSVKTIYRAPYSADGEVGEGGIFHSGEMHDGLTIDADGYLWSGIYGGGKVVRHTSDGQEDLTVELPAPNITSVAFGGDRMSTLFVTSARENLTEEQLEAHPLSGSVFAIETETHGRLARRFGAL